MALPAHGAAGRPRISIDVDPEFRRRVHVAAARREMSVRDYVLQAIEVQLRDEAEEEQVPGLTAAADPVLARLWDNPRDAEYDRL